MRRSLLNVLLLLLAATGQACAARNHREVQAPAITSIAPDSGAAGTAYPIEIIIVGRNFADTGNVVVFGPVTMRLPSTGGGTRIVFQAPKERRSSAEAPPMVLPPGVYQVRITTQAGESNAVSFTLSREPGA